jgi:hypothetical protein
MMGIQLKPQLEIPHTMTHENRSPAANGARQQIYHHVDAAASTEIAASAQALTPSLGVSDGVALYDRACAALAEAVAIDEILAIRDIAAALKSAAKIAGNREAEANALVLRLRATRRLGQLMPHAAPDCALFMWATWPKMPVWNEVIEAWGFRYSGLGFDWVKLNPNGEGLHKGNGYNTRQNSEPCLLAKRGSPLRLSAAGRRAQ